MKSISIFILLIYWSIILLAPVISEENKTDLRTFVLLRLTKLLPQFIRNVSGFWGSAASVKVLEQLPLSDKDLSRCCMVSSVICSVTMAAMICRKSKGVFMYGAEVLNQMNERNPQSGDDNKLVMGTRWIHDLPVHIAELYMGRYKYMFGHLLHNTLLHYYKYIFFFI